MSKIREFVEAMRLKNAEPSSGLPAPGQDQLQTPHAPDEFNDALNATVLSGPRGGNDDDGPGRPKDERISDASKLQRIKDLIRPLVPDPARREAFGRWLIKEHGGLPHDHFPYLNDELEHEVRNWQDEDHEIPKEEHDIRNRQDQEKAPKKQVNREKKGGGSGGSDGGASGSGQDGGPNAPAGSDPQDPASEMRSTVNEMNKAAENLENRHDKLESGKSAENPKDILKETEDLNAKAEKIVLELAKKPEFSSWKGKGLRSFLDFAQARFPNAQTINNLAGTFLLAKGIIDVLQADNKLDALGETITGFAEGKAVYGVAEGLAEAAGLEWGFIEVTFFLNLHDGPDPVPVPDPKEVHRQRNLATAKFLDKNFPGSVVINSGDDSHGEWYEVKDKKLWDATIKKLGQLRHSGAGELGVKDGLAASDRLEQELGKAARAESDQEAEALFAAYRAGKKAGLARREAALNRARDLGKQDAKTGKSSLQEIQNWPELTTVAKNFQPVSYQATFGEYMASYQAGVAFALQHH